MYPPGLIPLFYGRHFNTKYKQGSRCKFAAALLLVEKATQQKSSPTGVENPDGSNCLFQSQSGVHSGPQAAARKLLPPLTLALFFVLHVSF